MMVVGVRYGMKGPGIPFSMPRVLVIVVSLVLVTQKVHLFISV